MYLYPSKHAGIIKLKYLTLYITVTKGGDRGSAMGTLKIQSFNVPQPQVHGIRPIESLFLPK